MIVQFIKRLILKYGFGRKPEPWPSNLDYIKPYLQSSGEVVFGDVKARRLASIARERDALKDKLATARKQKKARRHLYAALETLKREEMQLAGDVR